MNSWYNANEACSNLEIIISVQAQHCDFNVAKMTTGFLSQSHFVDLQWKTITILVFRQMKVKFQQLPSREKLMERKSIELGRASKYLTVKRCKANGVPHNMIVVTFRYVPRLLVKGRAMRWASNNSNWRKKPMVKPYRRIESQDVGKYKEYLLV